jgi:Exonuclease VII, large subunit
MAEADGSAAETVELDTDDIVTVATLNDEIAAVIDQNHELTHDYIVGDASDCREANGHLHFDLVAGDASIHCVVFGFRYKGLNAKPDEEMHVAVRGELSYYEPQGSCSVIVENIVNMGESEYSQVYAENKEKLADDGLLDDEQKSHSRSYQRQLASSHRLIATPGLMLSPQSMTAIPKSISRSTTPVFKARMRLKS